VYCFSRSRGGGGVTDRPDRWDPARVWLPSAPSCRSAVRHSSLSLFCSVLSLSCCYCAG
jgi:hypothetical protein